MGTQIQSAHDQMLFNEQWSRCVPGIVRTRVQCSVPHSPPKHGVALGDSELQDPSSNAPPQALALTEDPVD